MLKRFNIFRHVPRDTSARPQQEVEVASDTISAKDNRENLVTPEQLAQISTHIVSTIEEEGRENLVTPGQFAQISSHIVSTIEEEGRENLVTPGQFAQISSHIVSTIEEEDRRNRENIQRAIRDAHLHLDVATRNLLRLTLFGQPPTLTIRDYGIDLGITSTSTQDPDIQAENILTP